MKRLDRLARTLLLMAALAPAAPIAAQTITFTFANGQQTASGYVFDVMAHADATLDGTRIGDTQVYVNYSTSAFGSNVAATSVVTEGTLMQDVSGQDGHEIVNVADNAPGRLAITTDYKFDGADAFSTALTTTPQQLVRVVLPIADGASGFTLSFEPSLMTGQQYDGTGAAIANVVATDQQGGVLPVELAAFTAVLEDRQAVLRWTTTSEENNAGFEVQRQTPTGWETLHFAPGAGTTREVQHYTWRTDVLPLGTHTFRLRQLDHDGRAAYSDEVEVAVALRERFVLDPPYPNPFNPETSIRFALQQAQPVRVELYDVLGRRVQVLFHGTPPAGEMQHVRLDGSALPSGVYFVRLVGADVFAVQRVLLMK